MENKKFAGYKAALGAFLVIFVNIGVCTTLGVFIAQLASFSGWSLSACVIIGTINTIVNLLLSLVAIPVAKKIGYRWTMLISILAVALHVNMYCFATPGQNVGTLICFYIGGALASVAIAFGSHAVCSGLIAEWFLDSHQREKVTGTVLSGAGFGAAIWVFLAGQLFKYFTWQQCYRIITVIALVFGLIAVLFLIRTPKEVGQLPMPAKEENDTVTDPSKLPGVTHKAALKSGSFWLLVIGMLCSVTACSNWTAVYLLISSLSLLIAGAVFKKLKSSGYTLLTHICMIACFALMLVWGANSSSFIMVLIVVTAGVCYPIDAAFPSMVAHGIFGPKEIALIIGNLMTAVYAGQLISSLLTSAVLATPGGFNTLWIVFGAVSIVGMVLVMLSIATSPLKKLNKAASAAN